MNSGLSFADIDYLIDNCDYRAIKEIVDEIGKQKQVERILHKIDIAEAFNAAYVGSKPDKRKRNQSSYKRWINRNISKVYKILGIKKKNVWDTMRRSRKL